jgi:hypothetical protein
LGTLLGTETEKPSDFSRRPEATGYTEKRGAVFPRRDYPQQVASFGYFVLIVLGVCLAATVASRFFQARSPHERSGMRDCAPRN